MEPSLPTARGLAVAGEWIAGGVGTHETALAKPGAHRPRRPVRATRIHRLARALPDLGDGPARGSPRGHQLARRGSGTRSRRAPRRPPGTWLLGRGWRSGDWQPPVEPRKELLDELAGETPVALMARDSHSGLAQLRRAGPRKRRPAGARRRRRAGPAGRADRRPARGVLLALPGRVHRDHRRRVRDGDARGDQAGQRARGHRRPRQGRLAGRVAVLAAPRVRRRAHPARLAVAAGRAGRRARSARDRERLRRPAAQARLPEGLHGRHPRLPDRAPARRLRGRDHKPRRVLLA
jgi:hypothetical protein